MGKSPRKHHGKLMNPKVIPLRKRPYGWFEDAGKWISTAGHNINKLVGGGNHEEGAKKIGAAGHAINKFVGKQFSDARKHYLGYGSLPKGPNFPRRETNKRITGHVNKHKYKKGMIMV